MAQCTLFTPPFQDADRDQPAKDRATIRYSLEPRTETSYAWDYPAARDKKILLLMGSSKRAIDIMEIGNLVPFRFNVSDWHVWGIFTV